ncbi:hypothetical protein [uncultured Eubacterium sp.]|uniref:hypothetical protein n=1 Tax=uncultured Eubacterium sp. TaxID=165185 RepID=UPI002594782C|nr:hypothetical protein [uncultured Eubacterium sp.]
MKIKDPVVNCRYCGEKRIPVKYRTNARGYGYYGVCPKCKKETVVEEVDTGRR